MTRIFPPKAKLNLALGSFQLEKDPTAVGTFSLSPSSAQSVATVNPNTGLVTLHTTGTVTVEFRGSDNSISYSALTIEDPESPQISHIDTSAEYVLSFFENNTITKDGFAVIFPLLYYSDLSFQQGLANYYTLQFSLDGKTFFDESQYLNEIPQINLDKNYNQAGLFGFKITCAHATTDTLTVRVIYTENGTSFTQDYTFTLGGPARISYSPFYQQRGFEIDLGTYLPLGASVLNTDGSYLEAASFATLNPDILDVQSNGLVYPLRSTQTDYLSYSDNKAALRVFTKVSGRVFATASSKLYEFENGNYTELLDFSYNLRALGTAEDSYVLTFVSYQDKNFPTSKVFKVNLARSGALIQEEVASVPEVATSFASVKLADGEAACVLATRYLDQSQYAGLSIENLQNHGQTKLYQFSHNKEKFGLTTEFSTNVDIIKKIIPGPDGYAYVLFQYGDIKLLNLSDGTYLTLLGTSSAETIAHTDNPLEFWRYTSDNHLYKSVVEWINDNPATEEREGWYAVTQNIDYGTLNTPTPSSKIYQASYIDGKHYLVFTKNPVTTQSLSDAIFPQEDLEPSPPSTVVNTVLGLLDLAKPVVGVIKMYSATDPFIQTTASFLINPSNTKHAYFLNYTGTVLNLPTDTSNLLPVQVIFSDNTVSYADEVYNVNSAAGLSLVKTTGSSIYQDEVYAVASKELNSSLKFETKFNDKLSKTFPANFYPQPTGVSIGNPQFSQNGFSVTVGTTLDILTYILLSGDKLYQKPLLLSGWDTDKVAITSGTTIKVSGTSVGSTYFTYRTPQPLPTYFEGTVYLSVVDTVKPSYINFLNFSDNSLVVPYKLGVTASPTEASGEVVFSDGTTSGTNNYLSWKLQSTSSNFTLESNKFSYNGITPEVEMAQAICSLSGVSITRDFYLVPYLVEDLRADVEIILPDYINKRNGFTRYSEIPNNRIDVYVRRANGSIVYGNSLVDFTVDSNSLLSSVDQGNLTLVDGEFGVAQVTVTLKSDNTISKEVKIQVGGPQYITSRLPYYLLDVGATETYFTGTIYDNNNTVIDPSEALVFNKSSSSSDEMTAGLEGVLRGSFARALPTETVNRLVDVSSTYESSFATLDDTGSVTYYDRFGDAIFKDTITHNDNALAQLVDFYRPEFGILVYHKDNDESILYKKDTSKPRFLNFSEWGSITGKVIAITSLRDTIYLVIESSGTSLLKTLSRNELTAADAKLGVISVPNPKSLFRDTSQIFCVTASGDGYLIYDTDNPSEPPRQMYSGVSAATTKFALKTDSRTIVDVDGKDLGQVPDNLTLLSAGYKFFFVDSATKTNLYVYEPYNTYSLRTVFSARSAVLEVPTTILPKGTAKDYFIEFTATPAVSRQDTGFFYIGDEITLTPKVYNSDGSVHTKADLYVAGSKVVTQDNDGLYKVNLTLGGDVSVKWVSKDDPDVYLEAYIPVRRKVKRIFVKNYIDANSAISVNVDRSVPLRAFVEYQDGYTDTEIDVSYTNDSGLYVEVLYQDNDLYLKGLSVTSNAVSVQLSPKEIELIEGIASADLSLPVKVLAPGSRALSTLYVPTALTVFEQSTSPAGVELFYTDGSAEPLYNEGFQPELDGIKVFTETLVDITVSADDTVYLLKNNNQTYSIDEFDTLGIYKTNYTLPTGNTYNLIRVLDKRIFISTDSKLFELSGSVLEPIFDDSSSIIADFKVSPTGYQILDRKSKKVIKLDAQAGKLDPKDISTVTPEDLVGFGQFSNAQYYFVSTTASVINQTGGKIITLPSVNGYAQFQDEIFVSVQHQISLGLRNGVVTTLAGSPFTGLYNGQGSVARFNNPTKIAVDSRRRIYVIDSGNKTLRRITDGYVETLLGGFWATEDQEIALGLGSQIIAKKPGLTTLKVSYRGMEDTLDVTVRPVYSRIEITNTDYTAYYNSTDGGKKQLNLSYQIYTLSGPIPADQEPISEIKYPPDNVKWSATLDTWVVGSVFSPLKEGLVTVYASFTDPLGTDIFSTNANFFSVKVEPTGIKFGTDFYKTKVNTPLDLQGQISLGKNDGTSDVLNIGDVGFTVSYLDDLSYQPISSNLINFGQEYDTVVRAEYQSFVSEVPLYVYDSGLKLVFSTIPFTVASGVTRRITGYHNPTTSLFHNKLISYSAETTITGQIALTTGGLVTALAVTPKTSGNLFGVSQLTEETGIRQINFSTSASKFSQFDPASAPTGIIHSGQVIYLRDVAQRFSIVDSSNGKTNVTLNAGFNFKISGTAGTLGVANLNGKPSFTLNFNNPGLFTGTYTHSLFTQPYADTIQTYELPYVAVAPTGIRVTIDDSIVEGDIYLVAGTNRNVKFELAYDPDGFTDFAFSNPYSADLIISRLPSATGIYTVTPAPFSASTQDKITSQATLTYAYNTAVKFTRNFITLRQAVAERVVADHRELEVLCLEALPDFLSGKILLQAKVFKSDNTDSSTEYKWVVDDQNVQGTDLKFTYLKSGDIFYAEETTSSIAPAKTTQKCVFYEKLEDITNPSHAEYLSTLGLLTPYRSVDFSPNFFVELDLDAQLPSSITAGARTAESPSTLDTSSRTELTAITEPFNMFEGRKAVFSRRTHVLSSGSDILFGDANCITYLVTESATTAVLRSTEPSTPITQGGSAYSGLVLQDGYVLYEGSTNTFFAYTAAGTSFKLVTDVTGYKLVYHTGNEFFAYSSSGGGNNKLDKIQVDFVDSTFGVISYNGNSNTFDKLLVSTAESFRYLKSDGIYIASGTDLSRIVNGNFSHGIMLNDNEFIVASDTTLSYVNMSDPTDIISLGKLVNSLGSAITELQLYTGNLLYAKVDSNKTISIDLSNSTTEFIAVHPQNINLKAKLDVRVLAPPENRTYNIVLTAEPPVIKKGTDTIALSGNAYSTSGTIVPADISVEKDYLKYVDNVNRYTALKDGTTTVTGTAGGLTGTLALSILPIPEAVIVTSPFMVPAAVGGNVSLVGLLTGGKFIVVNAGSSIPLDVKVKYSDGSLQDTFKTVVTSGGKTFTGVKYENGVLVASVVGTCLVQFVSLDNDSLFSTVTVQVLSSEEVVATNFEVGVTTADLLVGDTYVIPATVYYSDGSTDGFVSVTSSSPSVVAYSDVAVKAVGLPGPSSPVVTVKVKPRVEDFASPTVGAEKTITFNVKDSYGIVEPILDKNKFIIGIKIKSKSGPGYLTFTNETMPTIVEENSPSFFDAPLSFKEIDPNSSESLYFNFKPLKKTENSPRTAKLLFNLAPYVLEKNPLAYTVPDPTPVFEFDLSNFIFENDKYFMLRGDTVSFKAVKRYDSQSSEPLESGIVSIDPNGSKFTLQFSSPGNFTLFAGKDASSVEVTASLSGVESKSFTVGVRDSQPTSVSFYEKTQSGYVLKNEDTGFIFSEPSRDLYFALSDSTSTPIFLASSYSSPTVIGSGVSASLVPSVNPIDSRYFKFTYSGLAGAPLLTSLTASLTYGGTVYSGTLPIIYTPSRVTQLILTPYAGLSDARTVFVGSTFTFTLEAIVTPKAGHTKTRDFIKVGDTNPYLLSDVDFEDSTYRIFRLRDLIDFVYGGAILIYDVDYTIAHTQNNVIEFTFKSSSVPKGALQSFVAQLKNQPLTSDATFSIMVEESPTDIVISRSDLDFYKE